MSAIVSLQQQGYLGGPSDPMLLWILGSIFVVGMAIIFALWRADRKNK